MFWYEFGPDSADTERRTVGSRDLSCEHPKEDVTAEHLILLRIRHTHSRSSSWVAFHTRPCAAGLASAAVESAYGWSHLRPSRQRAASATPRCCWSRLERTTASAASAQRDRESFRSRFTKMKTEAPDHD